MRPRKVDVINTLLSLYQAEARGDRVYSMPATYEIHLVDAFVPRGEDELRTVNRVRGASGGPGEAGAQKTPRLAAEFDRQFGQCV